GVILAYGLARVLSQGFNELRNGVFAKVAQRAVRRIALSAFRHIHSLSLRFHLERRTGGLARAVERGIAGIEFLLSFMLFNVIPTLFEIVIVSAILWRLYNWTFAAVTLATIVTYIAFTFIVTDWRVRFRREMNERNSEANTKSVDSLLNYETVKYFANEEHEAQRYDRALHAYERAAVKSETTLALLNVGQGAIIASGLIGIMLLAGHGGAARRGGLPPCRLPLRPAARDPAGCRSRRIARRQRRDCRPERRRQIDDRPAVVPLLRCHRRRDRDRRAGHPRRDARQPA